MACVVTLLIEQNLQRKYIYNITLSHTFKMPHIITVLGKLYNFISEFSDLHIYSFSQHDTEQNIPWLELVLSKCATTNIASLRLIERSSQSINAAYTGSSVSKRLAKPAMHAWIIDIKKGNTLYYNIK